MIFVPFITLIIGLIYIILFILKLLNKANIQIRQEQVRVKQLADKFKEYSTKSKLDIMKIPEQKIKNKDIKDIMEFFQVNKEEAIKIYNNEKGI